MAISGCLVSNMFMPVLLEQLQHLGFYSWDKIQKGFKKISLPSFFFPQVDSVMGNFWALLSASGNNFTLLNFASSCVWAGKLCLERPVALNWPMAADFCIHMHVCVHTYVCIRQYMYTIWHQILKGTEFFSKCVYNSIRMGTLLRRWSWGYLTFRYYRICTLLAACYSILTGSCAHLRLICQTGDFLHFLSVIIV